MYARINGGRSRRANRFSGLRAASYHATNVALHGLATGLVLYVARTVTCRRSALLSASLFAVHPVHADAVASVVGRADILSCVFFMLSFLCYSRHVRVRNAPPPPPPSSSKTGAGRTSTTAAATVYLAFCVLFALMSMLAKENGVSVMAVCIGYELMLMLRSIKSHKVSAMTVYGSHAGFKRCREYLLERVCNGCTRGLRLVRVELGGTNAKALYNV